MKKDDVSAARILLVDDNARGMTARKMILTDLGYAVETALSGEEAWEIFQKHSFDVVVTDLRMGGIDGVELIRRIRATDAPTGIILAVGLHRLFGFDAGIVRSRRADQQEQQRGSRAGAGCAEAGGASAAEEACLGARPGKGRFAGGGRQVKNASI